MLSEKKGINFPTPFDSMGDLVVQQIIVASLQKKIIKKSNAHCVEFISSSIFSGFNEISH